MDTSRFPGIFLRCAQEGKLIKALLQMWSQRRDLDPCLWGHSSVQRARKAKAGDGEPGSLCSWAPSRKESRLFLG